MEPVLTDNPAFTHSILGTADPEEILHRLDAFCEAHLGLGVDACSLAPYSHNDVEVEVFSEVRRMRK